MLSLVGSGPAEDKALSEWLWTDEQPSREIWESDKEEKKVSIEDKGADRCLEEMKVWTVSICSHGGPATPH